MKKFLSLLLAAMMILSVMPMTALADGMKSLDLTPIGEASAPAEEPAAKEPVLLEAKQSNVNEEESTKQKNYAVATYSDAKMNSIKVRTANIDRIEIINANGELAATLKYANPVAGIKGVVTELEAGTYTYAAYQKDVLLGSGNFIVKDSESQQTLNMTKVVITYNMDDSLTDEGYKIKGHIEYSIVEDKIQVAPGNENPEATDKKVQYIFVIANFDKDPVGLNVEFIPDDDMLAAEPYYENISSQNTKNKNIWVFEKERFTLRVPNEYADLLKVYQKGQIHYVAFREIECDERKECDDGYTEMSYYARRQSTLHYTIFHSDSLNNIKLSREFQVDSRSFAGEDIAFTVLGYSKDKNDYAENTGLLKEHSVNFDLDNSFRIDINDYLKADLYLSVDDSNYINMSAGATKKIEAFRVWQAVDSVVSNYFIEPDFHYEIIGDSISIEQKGAEGRKYAEITALKEGISVIKVTYDAEYFGIVSGKNGEDNYGYPLYYNAIEPENTRTVIVNVGGKNTANIESGIEQTEYDTIYFNKNFMNCAEFTFTPTADDGHTISVRVHDPLHNTEWGKAWTSYNANNDGSYTVKLKDGRNVIEIAAEDGSVCYYVVNCRGVDVEIINRTREDSEYFVVGDTVEISFDGLTLPVQKMAAIYNPNYPSNGWVEYIDSNGETIKSRGDQYVAYTKDVSKLTVSSANIGEYKLIGGSLHSTHLGSPLNTHRNIPTSGFAPNLNASTGTKSPYFCKMPEISITFIDESTLNVINLIKAIGSVTKDSGDTIKVAREAYDALTPEQKKLVSADVLAKLVKAERVYGMIVGSNKPDASDKGDKTDGIIKISATGAAKGEENPNTGAPAMSIAPAVLVLTAAAIVLKKHG